MARYALNELFDGNTNVQIGNQYLRPNNELGKVPYWWGAKLKASEKLIEYIQHTNAIENSKM